ncbi:recombinase family protein, partial [Chloroflexota bacterium]
SNFRAQMGAKQGLEDRARGRSKKNNFQEMPPTKAKVYGMQWRDGMYRPDENYDNACLVFDLWFERRNKGYIARELCNRGIPSSSGNRIWDASSLGAILTNPVYTGRVATLKYERVEPRKRSKTTTFGKSSAHLKPEEEWHWLTGNPVERPIITWQQRLEIKRGLALNQTNSPRNNKHQDLAKGIIECMLCHRKHYGVTPSNGGRRRYVCSNNWAQPAYVDKCLAKSLDREEVDTGLKAKLMEFLEKPEVFIIEAQSRLKTGKSKQGIEAKLKDLEKQRQRNIIEERRKVNLLTDEAFQQEQDILLSKRKWLNEEIEQEKVNLLNLQTYSLQQETIESMTQRLQHNLDNATFEDWRLIIDALGVKIMAFGDGT